MDKFKILSGFDNLSSQYPALLWSILASKILKKLALKFYKKTNLIRLILYNNWTLLHHIFDSKIVRVVDWLESLYF